MDVNPDQIRQALIDIADLKGRPPFELVLVREVINSIKNQQSHHLKEAVLSHIKNKLEAKKEEGLGSAARLSKLRTCCNTETLKNELANMTGLSYSLINSMVRGRYEITTNLWLQVEPCLDQIAEKNTKINQAPLNEPQDLGGFLWG